MYKVHVLNNFYLQISGNNAHFSEGPFTWPLMEKCVVSRYQKDTTVDYDFNDSLSRDPINLIIIYIYKENTINRAKKQLST